MHGLGFLRDAANLGVLDRSYLFDTELRAGWHDSGPTTTPARKAMASLRIAAINAHQRIPGSLFIFAPSDPTVYNLMVRYLVNVRPVYAWDAPLLDADYSSLVYKLFIREVPGTALGEDIIASWSNAETAQALALSLATGSIHFSSR